STHSCCSSDDICKLSRLLSAMPLMNSKAERCSMGRGGLTSQKCILQGAQKGDLSTVAEFYLEDNNSLQNFLFKAEPLDKLKITFQNSSDFFWRIITYHLDILGQKL
uniref:Uncharacterized protein n=1 Tax=Naja naja TaxID=35670 RepID=A0A8C6VDK0_NAJNA